MNAEPLTAEEEAKLRDDVARSDAGTFRWVVPDDIRRLLATLDRSRETQAQLARLLDEALGGMAASGHVLTSTGYCARCEGSCLVGFANQPEPVAFVDPSPIVVRS